MDDREKRIDDAIKALREGRSQEADNQLSALKRELAAESGAASPPSPAPPREPNVILIDFARAVVEHLGSPPALKRLLEEAETALQPAKPQTEAEKF